MCFFAAIALVPVTGRAGEQASVIERYGLEESEKPARELAGWRKPKRILIGGMAAQAAPRIASMSPDVEFVTAQNAVDAASKAKDVDAVIGVCTPDIVAAGKSIRWIQLTSAGVEHCVRIPGVRERGILVTNMQRIGGPIIAEHAIAMALAFTRGLDFYIPAQAKREWARTTPPGRMAVVDGKTMLVVGLGGIGGEVAQRAHDAPGPHDRR